MIKSLIWATDIHLDCAYRKDFYEVVSQTEGDGLLITGDIANGNLLSTILAELSEKIFIPIFFVLGNHDFWDISSDEGFRLAEKAGQPTYLTAEGPISLSPKSALVRVDGWADAGYGDYDRGGIFIRDSLRIEDFVGKPREELKAVMTFLAKRDAKILKKQMLKALQENPDLEKMIVATHVPPFKEAAFYLGNPTEDDFLPFFTSKSSGKVIEEVSKVYPDTQFEVYCGHTHDECEVRISDNITIYVGGAEYGYPEIQKVIEV